MEYIQPLASIVHDKKTINFTFHTGALVFLRELGYAIDYNLSPDEQLKTVPHIEDFFADFLFVCAKFYSRKDPNFGYDRFDAHDWIEPFGGVDKVAQAFIQSQRPGVKIPIGTVIPNETPKKSISVVSKK